MIVWNCLKYLSQKGLDGVKISTHWNNCDILSFEVKFDIGLSLKVSNTPYNESNLGKHICNRNFWFLTSWVQFDVALNLMALTFYWFN